MMKQGISDEGVAQNGPMKAKQLNKIYQTTNHDSDKLHVNIDLKSLLDESVRKPIAMFFCFKLNLMTDHVI